MATLARQLLAFYDREGRHLPWRGERDLYRIWVSEVMLQQTGVVTVLPYYERFLERFPDVQSLARAEEGEVLTVWQGLGYYRRARHLHQAAQRVVESMGGIVPEQLTVLLSLPGIGPSTAAAILAIGRDQPHAILDGNVKRVLARLMALPDSLSTGKAQRELWALAKKLTPSQRPGDYAQAIMDLGATVCTRTRPACDRCPWQTHCLAHAQGKSTAFPVLLPRPPKPRRTQWSALVMDGQKRLLFYQRPPEGLLAGLWEPPSVAMEEGDHPLEGLGVTHALLQRFGLETTHAVPLQHVQHTFTHFHLRVHPFICFWEQGQPRLEGCQAYRWLALEKVSELPMATLDRKILDRFYTWHGERGHGPRGA